MSAQPNTGRASDKKVPSMRAVMVRVIMSGIFAAGLGVLLAFMLLVRQAPQKYDPKPDAKTGKMPAPPAGIWYWAGSTDGNWQPKEAAFLAGNVKPLTITDGEFNAWAKQRFKPATPDKTAAAKPAADAKDKDKAAPAAAPSDSMFGVTPGTVNLHSFSIPGQPDSAPAQFQVAVPLDVTLYGDKYPMLFQIRGTFAPGSGGPKFEADYLSVGSARLPGAGLLANYFFGAITSSLAQSDDGKQLLAAWAAFNTATPKDGELVLEGK